MTDVDEILDQFKKTDSPPTLKTMKNTLLFSLFALVTAPATAATLLDFESYALGSDLPTNGWSMPGADGSAITVVATVTSGDYAGGRAIETDAGGATFAGRLISQPGISGIQVDMNWAFSGTPGGSDTPTIQLHGWDDDGDGIYAAAERQVGLAMDNTGTNFEFMNAGGSENPGDLTTTFSANTWYRLSLDWTPADGGGNRDLTLRALDLTNGVDLGVVNTVTMTGAQFGSDPADWDGVTIRMTRGTMDNITLIPEPGSVLLGLTGVVLGFLRRRR